MPAVPGESWRLNFTAYDFSRCRRRLVALCSYGCVILLLAVSFLICYPRPSSHLPRLTPWNVSPIWKAKQNRDVLPSDCTSEASYVRISPSMMQIVFARLLRFWARYVIVLGVIQRSIATVNHTNLPAPTSLNFSFHLGVGQYVVINHEDENILRFITRCF